MSYYVISLKHTRRSEPVITFWKPDNRGYCCDVERAGLYEQPIPGYHINDGNIARPKHMVAPLLKKMSYGDFKNKLMLPNTKKVWLALGEPEVAENLQ